MKLQKIKWICVLLVLVMVVVTGCTGNNTTPSDAPSDDIQTYEWKMATTWVEGTYLYQADKRFADNIEKLSNGQLKVKLYGEGQLAAANQVHDLVKNETVQMGGDWSGYWSGKGNGYAIIGVAYFGMRNVDMATWIYHGGGFELFNEVYAQDDMLYFPHSVAPIESGWWSTKPITGIEDLKKLKVRASGGLPGRHLQMAGITPVAVPAAELYEAFQRGVIDVAELATPAFDESYKLHEVANHVLMPAFQGTGAPFGTMVNKAAYEELPEHLQYVIDAAARLTMQENFFKQQWDDCQALKRMQAEADITFHTFPKEDLLYFQDLKNQMYEEVAEEDPLAKKIIQSQVDFYNETKEYFEFAEQSEFNRGWITQPNIK